MVPSTQPPPKKYSSAASGRSARGPVHPQRQSRPPGLGSPGRRPRGRAQVRRRRPGSRQDRRLWHRPASWCTAVRRCHVRAGRAWPATAGRGASSHTFLSSQPGLVMWPYRRHCERPRQARKNGVVTDLVRVWIIPCDVPPEIAASCEEVLDDGERAGPRPSWPRATGSSSPSRTARCGSWLAAS